MSNDAGIARCSCHSGRVKRTSQETGVKFFTSGVFSTIKKNGGPLQILRRQREILGRDRLCFKSIAESCMNATKSSASNVRVL